jgi:hypothetical protein
MVIAEGEFDFEATHDGLGHVELRIRMRGGLHAEDGEPKVPSGSTRDS